MITIKMVLDIVEMVHIQVADYKDNFQTVDDINGDGSI